MSWRNRDNAPIGNTCPIIDDVMHFIKSIDWSEDEKDIEKEANIALTQLEKVREANSTLRDWGNQQCKEAAYFENECDDLRKTNNSLEDEINYLKRQIKELEKELSEIQ